LCKTCSIKDSANQSQNLHTDPDWHFAYLETGKLSVWNNVYDACNILCKVASTIKSCKIQSHVLAKETKIMQMNSRAYMKLVALALLQLIVQPVHVLYVHSVVVMELFTFAVQAPESLAACTAEVHPFVRSFPNISIFLPMTKAWQTVFKAVPTKQRIVLLASLLHVHIRCVSHASRKIKKA
jgi:hypothetical protein